MSIEEVTEGVLLRRTLEGMVWALGVRRGSGLVKDRVPVKHFHFLNFLHRYLCESLACWMNHLVCEPPR